mmetsp:Transcript_71844/g.150086  ORF Transcript_71844/g.150086 Transcript_71844/m.150086 type:complete len:90 (+) Transcript_71844:1239-1508(+)
MKQRGNLVTAPSIVIEKCASGKLALGHELREQQQQQQLPLQGLQAAMGADIPLLFMPLLVVEEQEEGMGRLLMVNLERKAQAMLVGVRV